MPSCDSFLFVNRRKTALLQLNRAGVLSPYSD